MENTTEIMENEEVLDLVPAEEIAEATSGNKGLKIAAEVGVTAIVTILVYKYVATPLMAKWKARKQERPAKNDVKDADYYEVSDEVEEE